MPLRRAIPALLTRIETGPTFFGDLFGDSDAVVTLGDVEEIAHRLAAGIFDFFCHIGCRRLVRVEQHHACAFAGIAVRNRAPDAGACAGDDSDVILEKWHGSFLDVCCFLRAAY
jgi:hypothetical protein